VLELAGVPVDPEHHVLEDVLGGVAVANATRDEREERLVELLEDARRVHRSRGGYRQPQPSSLDGAQQSVLASSAQQDVCSAGEQQPALLTCGSGVGVAGGGSGRSASRRYVPTAVSERAVIPHKTQ
jgi:hypothetical protein